MNRLQRLHDAGVSIWLDTLSRDLLESGEFAGLVDDFAVSGATSNPTIFAKAITGSERYDDQLRSLLSAGVADPRELFFAVALDDVRRAAAVLRPSYERADGRDGFVSFECTPDLADDTDGTIAQALDLRRRLDLANVLIKVPATRAGVAAIEELTARGVNVNVTLLFSVERYEEVIEAYLRGLERRVAAGEAIDRIASVASFFVSRVDSKADAALAPGRRCAGRSRSPTRTSPTGAIWSASPASAGARCRNVAPGPSARCGRARGPRTRPTPTCSTSSSSSRRA